MVLYFEWHRTAMEAKKSNSCLSMTGEDTGLEALASPLAGYLGKVLERAESLEFCPWCTSKGFTFALRSYHINLQESITLCTNPQCLFPLVTRPLEDVLSSLVPAVTNKRKNTLDLEKEDLIESPLKRPRSSKVGNLELQQQSEHGSVNPLPHGLPETPSENVNGNHKDCMDTEAETLDSLQDEALAPPPPGSASFGDQSDILLNDDRVESALSLHLGVNGSSENNFKEKDVPVSNGCSKRSPSQDLSSKNDNSQMILGNEQTPSNAETSLIVDLTERDADGIRSESADVSSLSLRQSEELVSVPRQLLWVNSDNLCWLDSLLSALVNCKTLRRLKPKDEPLHSSVWQLMKGYEDICASVQVHQQTGQDGVVRVPSHVLHKADVELQSLRMSVFKQLQPKLRCILGQRETPVFAMPLLLTMDSWVEHLFQSTFHWEFKCSRCQVVTKERVVKTLPTFTNVVPDWRPLNAVHVSSCNMCGEKNQRRTMLLESVPAVFALHFVEGLPDSDVDAFAFSFQAKRYSVTTVIQYSHRLKHFVTWMKNDESWLEYDDLEHPDFRTHQKLQIRAHEMHVVFWEVEEDADPPAPRPLDTFAEQPAPEMGGEPLDPTLDRSLALHDDTDIVDALTENGSDITDVTVTAGADASIGSTTLLDAFEGLSHDDIITLTLVEVAPANSETQRLNDNQQTEGVSVGPEPSPDSSLPAAGGDVCHSAGLQPLGTLGSSNSESVDSSSTDATPAARRGRRRGARQKKTISKQSEEEAVSEDAPQTSPASSEPPVTVSQETDGPDATPAARRGRRRGARQKKTISKQSEEEAVSEDAPQTSPASSEPPVTVSQETDGPDATPAARRGRRRGARQKETISKQSEEEAVSEDAPQTSPASSEPPVTVSQETDGPADQDHQASPESSTDTSPLPTVKKNNPLDKNVSWSFLLSKHSLTPPFRPTSQPAPTPRTSSGTDLKSTEPVHSTPNPVKRPAIPSGLSKPQLLTKDGIGLPPKAAEMYGGFGAKSSTDNSPLPSPSPPKNANLFQTITAHHPAPLKKHSTSKVPPGLSETEALRYKLMKKLKAKKKKLAKLNQLLGNQERLQPDSTGLNSPSTVASSVHSGYGGDDFLSDLLSPATTASNLSPDSTGFSEMLTSGQEGANRAVSAAGATSQANCGTEVSESENFLEDFLMQCCGFEAN